jgi:hypothetical protein
MMYTLDSNTAWRDKPIIPDGYEDVARLVGLARKARGRVVEFDWAFTRDDLLRLRRAVFEWGSAVSGRYKCFDARVLAAVNSALGEEDSIFYLAEPRNTSWLDARAECSSANSIFRLKGHAPFDIIFGYGSAAGDSSPAAREHLGVTALATLVAGVVALGWDIERLQDERYRPVRNVLYGMRPDYGVAEPVTPSSEPPVDVAVNFHGPFSLVDDGHRRCLFADAIASRNGVYLWTIEVGGEQWPWYVGQTRRGFGQRMAEHIACYLSGQNLAPDAAALARGQNRFAPGVVKGSWPEVLPAFLNGLPLQTPNIIQLMRLVSIQAAPLTGDAHLHNRVEGALGRHLKRHSGQELGDFFFPGMRVPLAIPGDKPMRLVLTSETPIKGLQGQIHA